MSLFLSTSIHKIDRKGRVSVPAAFRAALESESFRGVALAPPLTDLPCLEGCGLSRVEKIASALDGLNPLSPETDALATAVLASMRQIPFDGEGRILLSEELMTSAELTDQALFAGLGAKFQIWRPERFEERRQDARALARAHADRLPWRGAAGRPEEDPPPEP